MVRIWRVSSTTDDTSIFPIEVLEGEGESQRIVAMFADPDDAASVVYLHNSSSDSSDREEPSRAQRRLNLRS